MVKFLQDTVVDPVDTEVTNQTVHSESLTSVFIFIFLKHQLQLPPIHHKDHNEYIDCVCVYCGM